MQRLQDRYNDLVARFARASRGPPARRDQRFEITVEQLSFDLGQRRRPGEALYIGWEATHRGVPAFRGELIQKARQNRLHRTASSRFAAPTALCRAQQLLEGGGCFDRFTVNNEDGAGRMFGADGAYGAKQQSGKAAMASATDDKQIGV
jgi:hypothetical protein